MELSTPTSATADPQAWTEEALDDLLGAECGFYGDAAGALADQTDPSEIAEDHAALRRTLIALLVLGKVKEDDVRGAAALARLLP